MVPNFVALVVTGHSQSLKSANTLPRLYCRTRMNFLVHALSCFSLHPCLPINFLSFKLRQLSFVIIICLVFCVKMPSKLSSYVSGTLRPLQQKIGDFSSHFHADWTEQVISQITKRYKFMSIPVRWITPSNLATLGTSQVY